MRRILWVLLCLMVSPAADQQLTAQQRPYHIDDWFSTEEIVASSVTVAPEGQALALTKRRAANTQVANSLLIPETRSDIWLQEAPGQPARNLTKGQADSSGWWAPRWSPDGQRLAFLSSRGGEVRVWGWERARNQLRLLSPSGVDFAEHGGCRWVDAHRLLCLVVPEGHRSTPTSYDGKPVESAEVAWAKAKRGEPTASVVNSLEFWLPQRRLLLVDVRTGSEQVLATTLIDNWGSSPTFWLAPTGQAMAFVRPGLTTYGVYQRAQMGFPAAVDLRRLDGRPLRLSQPLPANVVTSTLQWSPDGQALAFFALGDVLIHPELLYGEGAREVRYPAVASKEYPGQLWRVDLARGVVERLPTGDIDLGQSAAPPAFQWTAAGEFLFRAPRLVQGARPLTPAEPAWLVLGHDGRTRALVPSAGRLPEALEPLDGGAAFLGLLDGEVWLVDPGKGRRKHLTARFDPRVQTMVAVTGAKTTTQLVVSSLGATPRSAWEQMLVRLNFPGVEDLRDYALLDLTTGVTTPLRKPGARGAVIAYDAVSRSALWLAADGHRGTFLWRSAGPSPAPPLVATNTFWKDVIKGEQRTIEYRTLNGEPMQAKLVLPVGYKPGRRYPLVVDFDIGYTAERSHKYAARDPSTLPAFGFWEEPFAALGYVYMFASWPVTSMDQLGRGNLLLGPNGIIPAVDEAIRLGIADPERLFLFGVSSAGYGVYALVTQTSRFRAAAASAGWVDNITERLTPSIHERYTENPFDGAMLGGARYIRSPLPFWRNGETYRRNSPLTYVDRVQTPLLILHGDLDPVQITEPEMFFKALVMQRKPAQFVRYWGEGHGNKTPANLRDSWQRLFAWYDQWGDITRDANGNMVFDGDRVKSRGEAPALRSEDYAKFPLFGPGGATKAAASKAAD